LVSIDLQATMIVVVRPVPAKPDAPVSASALRAQARIDHPNAEVVDQFEICVENWRGPAIEIEWSSGLAKKVSARIAQVPFPGGILSFFVQAPTPSMRACNHPFNQLLLSIRTGLNSRSASVQQFLRQL
jgi:hypothetical protein